MTVQEFCNAWRPITTIYITYGDLYEPTGDIAELNSQTILAVYKSAYFIDRFYNENLYKLQIKYVRNTQYGINLQVESLTPVE